MSSLKGRKTHISTPPVSLSLTLLLIWRLGKLSHVHARRDWLNKRGNKREAPRRGRKVKSSNRATQKKKSGGAFLSLGWFFFQIFILQESSSCTMLLLLLLLLPTTLEKGTRCPKSWLIFPFAPPGGSARGPDSSWGWWLESQPSCFSSVWVRRSVADSCHGCCFHSPTWRRSGWSRRRTGRS